MIVQVITFIDGMGAAGLSIEELCHCQNYGLLTCPKRKVMMPNLK